MRVVGAPDCVCGVRFGGAGTDAGGFVEGGGADGAGEEVAWIDYAGEDRGVLKWWLGIHAGKRKMVVMMETGMEMEWKTSL